MRPNGKEAKTYQDLMQLLPDVARILIWWTHDEDGVPGFAERIQLWGHDGQQLVEATADEVEGLPDFRQRGPAEKHALQERLAAVFAILDWADAFALDEGPDGASLLELPSASHVGDAPPAY
ncbi:hypothetical protein GCM10009807_01670 [Microbacterium lacus]|uniref:Uncharacterized protein n=2 Tax=Microbacterium lacus TaxID=415217 RepID=A0ABP4RTM2_9MICO